MTEIHGDVAPGFEKVRDAFQKNFDEGKEIGAAFSAYHRGTKVVDLWGGIADEESGKPWEQDTIILVFSTTKGATAICANKLAQDGLLDVDAPVVEYWPEFAANGKQDVPVSYLLSHQAGLAWIDGEMTTEEALSWDPVVAALAAQKPSWEPGSQHGYHATTYGWLVGEVIRRITGKSVGTYFHEQVASPLGLDFWIGLPAEYESRVAMLTPMIPGEVSVEKLRDPGDDPIAQMMAAFLGPETMLGRALFAPGGALTDQKIWNSRRDARGRGACRQRCQRRSFTRSDVCSMRRRYRRRAPVEHRADQTRHHATDQGPEQDPHGHGHPVRSGIHVAVDSDDTRRPSRVRPLRRRRFRRLGRP